MFKPVIKLHCIAICVLTIATSGLCFGGSGFGSNYSMLPPANGDGAHFGIKAGLNSSNFSQNEQRNKVGFTAGLAANIGINPFLGIEADLFYTLEGANQVNSDFIYDGRSITINNMTKVNSNLTFHTIEIPVLVCLKVPGISDMAPKLMIGGVFDYYAKIKTANLIWDQTNNLVLSSRTHDDVTSSFNRINYGVMVGTGIDFYGTKLGCSIEVRYKLGLNTINSLGKYNIGNYYREDFSMNSLQILFGISF
jgi:hypothetical protein